MILGVGTQTDPAGALGLWVLASALWWGVPRTGRADVLFAGGMVPLMGFAIATTPAPAAYAGGFAALVYSRFAGSGGHRGSRLFLAGFTALDVGHCVQMRAEDQAPFALALFLFVTAMFYVLGNLLREDRGPFDVDEG
jgi:hypothetical protein